MIRVIKISIVLSFLLIGLTGFAQENIPPAEKWIPVESFHELVASGVAEIVIVPSDSAGVLLKGKEKDFEKYNVISGEGRLTVNTQRNLKSLNAEAWVFLAEGLSLLEASGASEVKSKGILESDELNCRVSGAAEVTLKLEANYLESKVSGAGELNLSGTAKTHLLNVSGAGELNAGELETEVARYNVSGAGEAFVNVSESITGTKKGAAEIRYKGNPVVKSSGTDPNAEVKVNEGYSADSVKVKVGNVSVEVVEGDDSVKVRVGSREIIVDENGNVEYRRCKTPRFNGHWAGFDLGLNGYVTPDGNQVFPPEYEYLDLRMTKSLAVNLNFFEQNIALSKNQKWGMVTGLGISWNNYRFSRPTRLDPDSSQLTGYQMENISIRKSKLVNTYLSVPLMIEFQTNSRQKKNSFHFATGMIASARLSTHTKIYYDELNKEYALTRYNPATGEYEPVDNVYPPVSPGEPKTKKFDDYHQQPFKFDATVRIGWGFINLFATYSVNQMFKAGKGPELYPWSIGITLTNF